MQLKVFILTSFLPPQLAALSLLCVVGSHALPEADADADAQIFGAPHHLHLVSPKMTQRKEIWCNSIEFHYKS